VRDKHGHPIRVGDIVFRAEDYGGVLAVAGTVRDLVLHHGGRESILVLWRGHGRDERVTGGNGLLVANGAACKWRVDCDEALPCGGLCGLAMGHAGDHRCSVVPP
jgi:hypothetical protein